MTASSPLQLSTFLTFSERLSGTTSHRGKSLHVEAPAGIYELVAEDSSGRYFEAETGQITVNGDPGRGGLYMPYTHGESAGLYWNWSVSVKKNSPITVYIAYLPAVPIPSNKSTVPTIPEGYYVGLVSTLSYVGVSGDEIRFVYREYADGLARSAFTQEVALNYQPGKTFAYKTAKFVVHEADSLGISYTLLERLK